LKKDIDLARRIRGDVQNDFRDLNPVKSHEVFYSLPYTKIEQGMSVLEK
jgi:hypothetical protein